MKNVSVSAVRRHHFEQADRDEQEAQFSGNSAEFDPTMSGTTRRSVKLTLQWRVRRLDNCQSFAPPQPL
jgi:hypothetical protein